MSRLRPGTRLHCAHSATPCVVEPLIGEGGQGEVYRATLDGRPCALKWYNDLVLRVDRGLQRRLAVAIDMGPPAPCFLWPFELVSLPDGSRLGYLMRLRRPGHVALHGLLAQQVQPGFRVLATLGLRLTDALFALHAKGLAYRDLNAGNVFLDPHSGEIEICDNDNVDVDGAPSVMGGVWEYQAPEVVLRQAGPSRATDLHSLAVMLFRILHVGHPLLGARELAFPNTSDPKVMRRLFGSEPRFVFDPADESNRPLPDRHGPVLGHWALYPPFLRELFVRAFTIGLHDPAGGRVQEAEWRQAMRRLLDAVQRCPHCGAQNFYDAGRIAAGQPAFGCWRCTRPISSSPLRLGLLRPEPRGREGPLHVIVLEPGARLHGHHLGRADGDALLGEVDEAMQLQHRGGARWTLADGRLVEPGGRVPLQPGLRLRFGGVDGVVRA